MTFASWLFDELELGGDVERLELEVYGRIYSVRANSLRLCCLSRNPQCVKCGVVGDVWLLQSYDGESPHLNLYAVSGDELILMTRDHIVPRSRGGPDTLDNLQTMCAPCNLAKDNKMPEHCGAMR